MKLRVDLNLPRGERQRHFTDYLNSALRSRTQSYSGSAGMGEDRLFRSTMTGLFPLNTATAPLTWEMVKDINGALLYLEVECTDKDVGEAVWKTAAYEFVTSVLTAALSDKRRTFFQRVFFEYIGPQLDGEYWLPNYRLAPAFPADTEPFLINAERILAIDMLVSAIDEQNAMVLASEAARRHAARLSLLLNVGLYAPASFESRWVVPVIDGKPANESARYHLGFSQPGIIVREMPKKGELCALGQYKGTLAARYRVAGQLLSLPPQARKILRGVERADPLVTDAFDRGSRLYQVGLVVGQQFPSVGLAYRIAAVEAIAVGGKTASSFAEFMRKHITSTSDLDEILDYMYGSVRSAHFHSGEFPLGEFARVQFFDPLMDSESLERSSLHRVCYELTREAIVNWMSSLVPETHPAESDNAPPTQESGQDETV